jgi:hypothetical protein
VGDLNRGSELKSEGMTSLLVWISVLYILAFYSPEHIEIDANENLQSYPLLVN